MKINSKAILGSAIVGSIIVIAFAAMTGGLATPLFPLLSMMSGFVFAGALYGYLSEGETVIEPLFAALITAIVSYFAIMVLQPRAFSVEGVNFALVIAYMNGMVLSLAGAWVGEKLQLTYHEGEGQFEWGWVFAGIMMGLAVSLLLAALVIVIAGLYQTYVLITLSGGLLVTGFICAFRSPGDTMKEAAISGFITAVILLDVFVLALDSDGTFLTFGKVLLCLGLGTITSMLGGFVGERVQGSAA